MAEQLALAKRAPGLGDDAVALVGLTGDSLLEIWMQLDLVEDGHDAGLADDAIQMFGVEIGYADRAGAALLLQAHEGLPGIHEQAAMRRRPVDEVEIDVIGAEAFQAFVESAQGGVEALPVVPELRGQEDLATVYAGGL